MFPEMSFLYSYSVIILLVAYAGVISTAELLFAPRWLMQRTQQSALQLRGEMLGQRYCRGGDEEHATLFLEVQLIVSNKGNEPLVIPTDSHFLTEVVIAREEADLKSGRFVGIVPLHSASADRARLDKDDFARALGGIRWTGVLGFS
jgi:hypothetical protein